MGGTPSRVVVLAGPGPATNIIYHALEREFGPLTVVMEQPVARWELLQRRVRRLGLITVSGQVLFLLLVVPFLNLIGRSRIAEIVDIFQLQTTPVPENHLVRVTSVNSGDARELLARLDPELVVVSGTRIISEKTLRSVEAPFVNLHAGITPQYRGVHGGYWAIAEGRPDLAGTTVHVVDVGIDTGPILGQSTFETTTADTFATYPFLHVAVGLPILLKVGRQVLSGQQLQPCPPLSRRDPSRLRSHPTIWQYVDAWVRRSVK